MLDAPTAAAGREAVSRDQPDVIIIDTDLPDGSGLDLMREFLAKDPLAKIVVYSVSEAPMLAIQAIEGGAKGYVTKNGDPQNLREAVLSLARGGTWLPHDLVQEIAILKAMGNVAAKLSDRELTVLRLLARGRSMAEIASDINLSYKTVAADCASMRGKLKARTSSELVRIAVECKIV